MIPKIKEFKPTEVLEAVAYYKVVASKMYEIGEQHFDLQYEVTLTISSFNKNYIITINTVKKNV